jgi:hypothetical protein
MPRPSAKTLEARLGFNFQNGISKDRRTKEFPEIVRLLERVEDIKARHKTLGVNEIRQSESIKQQTLEILEDFGPTIWPDLDETGKRNTPWLFDLAGDSDPNENHLTTEYSKHLVFSDPIDHEM